MPYTRDEAIAFASGIPAIKAVYTPDAAAFLGSLVDFTAGTYRATGAIAYRPWIAASYYLTQAPELWLVKQHDRTTVGDPQSVIDLLLKQQGLADLKDGIIPPEGETAIATLNTGALIATRIGEETKWERDLVGERIAWEQQTLKRRLEWRPYI